MKTETGLKTAKTTVCSLFVVQSGRLTSGEKADQLWLWLKPLGIKKPDQTGLSNTISHVDGRIEGLHQIDLDVYLIPHWVML